MLLKDVSKEQLVSELSTAFLVTGTFQACECVVKINVLVSQPAAKGSRRSRKLQSARNLNICKHPNILKLLVQKCFFSIKNSKSLKLNKKKSNG